jgi:hypothetical protein
MLDQLIRKNDVDVGREDESAAGAEDADVLAHLE